MKISSFIGACTLGTVLALTAGCAGKGGQKMENAAIANPYIEVSSLNEAGQGAGFEMQAPDNIDGFQKANISYIKNELIQVIYEDGELQLYLRKGKGLEDISGDYNHYLYEEDMLMDGTVVLLKSGDDGIHCVNWYSDKNSFSITSTSPLAKGTVEKFVEATR